MNNEHLFKPCTKCGGSGEYRSRSGSGRVGTCFACRGFGRSFKNAAAKREYYALKEAKAESYVKSNAKWLVTVAFYYAATKDPIAYSVVHRAKRGVAPTPKMLACVYRGVIRLLTKLAAPPEVIAPVVEGTGVLVEGEVLSVKWRENPWGGGLKMLVKETRGFKVWGSVPSAISEVERGAVVRFVANVEASNDDECFGFFKRPRKAVVV